VPPPSAAEAEDAASGRLSAPPYWRLAWAVRAETAHTGLGEMQAVAAHAAFALAPTLVMLLLCVCIYYARMKDRGVTDIGFGGRTQVLTRRRAAEVWGGTTVVVEVGVARGGGKGGVSALAP
jgi:hypothetical protein